MHSLPFIVYVPARCLFPSTLYTCYRHLLVQNYMLVLSCAGNKPSRQESFFFITTRVGGKTCFSPSKTKKRKFGLIFLQTRLKNFNVENCNIIVHLTKSRLKNRRGGIPPNGQPSTGKRLGLRVGEKNL